MMITPKIATKAAKMKMAGLDYELFMHEDVVMLKVVLYVHMQVPFMGVKVELQEAQTLLMSHLLQKPTKQVAQRVLLLLRVVFEGHMQLPAIKVKVG